MILDAFGRPITKATVEEITASLPKSYMAPAYSVFARSADSMEAYSSLNGGPFVVASNDGHLPSDMEHADYSSTLTGNSPYSNLNDRFAHKNPIAELNTPRDTRGLMTLSMTHASENYIVARAIRIKKNFALRNVEFIGQDAARTFFQSEFRRLRLWKILGHAFRYYWSTGRVVIYWGEERPIRNITLLDPRFIIVRRVLGREIVFMLPDPRWKTILDEARGLKKDTPESLFLKKNLPKYWIQHINNGEPIPLKEDSYALIENDLDLFSIKGIEAPNNLPLQPIFKELATIEMLIAGDFSTAWMMKNMIALVSIGDPSIEKNYVRPDQNELQKLQTAFQRPEYAMWAYVDPTVDIRFISPDPKVFDQAKYKQQIEAVEYCLGVPAVFSRDAKGDFGGTSLSLKAFREEIVTARQDMQFQLFDKLLPVMKEGYVSRKTGSKIPELSYDLDCLKDDRVLQDELNGKYDRGGLSVRSLLEGKVHNYDTEITRKKAEEKDAEAGYLRPAYDLSHGLPGDDGAIGGGRPNTGGKPTAESNAPQTPRPSRPT